MEVLRYELTYQRPDEFKFYDLSDLHTGSAHFNEDMFKAKVREIAANPLARWLAGGDLGEFITPSDFKRWDSRSIADWVDPSDIGYSQEERIYQLVSPIQSQCIGLLLGNHEDSIRLHGNYDVHSHLCRRLDVPDLGYTCFVDLAFKRKHSNESHIFRVVATHGAGGAITQGAKVTRLQRFMDSFNARIYMHGHVHDIILSNKPYLDLTDAGRIVSRQKVGAMTGCWFTSYTQGIPPSYGEKKNYPPTSLGCPVFTVIPDKDFVAVQG